MIIDYFEDVRKIIAKQFGIEEEDIEEDTLLDADLNISELDVEDLVAVLEEKYEVEIPMEAYEKFLKVSDIVNFLYENAEAA